MISSGNEHDAEYSNLAAAWCVRVSWTLPGFMVVGLAGWLRLAGGLLAGWLGMVGIGHRPPLHIREEPILSKFATMVLGENFLVRLWCILQLKMSSIMAGQN